MEKAIYILNSSEKSKKAVSKIAYDFVSNLAMKQLKINQKPRLTCESNGKPFFEDYPNFHFNISHCENLVAVAVADSSVGVDIEKVRETNLKIAERFFTDEEKDFVKDSNSFFYVWTRKEALLKRNGEGLKNISKADVLENPEIKTFDENEFILSVSCEKPDSFKIIYEEIF